MRRITIILSILLATSALAAGWKKPYFGATPPGSWAQYSDTAPGMKMTTTVTRLEDDGGRARVSVKTVFANAQYPNMVNEYTLAPGFAVDRELIDYMAHATDGRTGTSDGDLQPLDARTVALMAKSSPAYGAVAVFKSTETVGGRKCDRYAYSRTPPGPPTVETGDLWLSDAVPFGLVKQTSTTKDAKGKVVSSYERTLVSTGAGKSSAQARVASAAPPAVKKPSVYTLKAAFDGGLIGIKAAVAANAKSGDRVHLVIESKGESFRLTVPEGRTTLHVDIPLGDFNFEVAARKSFELSAAKSAELDVQQVGDKRALEGRFEISVYEGTPLWSGNATVGFVKK